MPSAASGLPSVVCIVWLIQELHEKDQGQEVEEQQHHLSGHPMTTVDWM